MRFINTSLVYGIIIFFVASAAGIFGALFWLTNNAWLDLKKINQHAHVFSSVVLDDDGDELLRFSREYRKPLAYQEIPSIVINAFLAAEDHDFFSHNGISLRGIFRSILVNIKRGKVVQGASTITQQLVKLAYTDGSRTFKRKIKEQFLTIILESSYSKEQILEAYLNNIYFGCGIYGIAAASERIFNKKVHELTIDQAATLAGIVKSPANYCPLISPENAQNRRNTILECMLRKKMINPEEYSNLKELPLTVSLGEKSEKYSHLRELLRKKLEKLLGKQALYTQGYLIKSTIDKQAQTVAHETFIRYVTAMRTEFKQPIDGALISMDHHTGAIKSLIGGYSFKNSPYNRVFARRQLGSVFKPLVYTAALEAGLSLTDIEIDEIITLGTWTPHNVTRQFHGPMTRAHALARSNNIISIKTALATGLESIVHLAHRCHLNIPDAAYPSIALGCIDATAWETVAMFSIFAHEGQYVEPYLIEWIKDRFDNKINKHTVQKEQIISWVHASQIAQVLQHSMDTIRTRIPDILTTDAFGKTGTATQATTCWFAGATPERTTVLYLGRDDNISMGNSILAMKTALPLWLDVNKKIPCLEKKFQHEPSLYKISINPTTGITTKQQPSLTILQQCIP